MLHDKTKHRPLLLKDKAYQSLKEWIQQARVAPGEFLSERKLASMLGMSKTPIKSALERLEQEGFVVVSPQQGIVVRELSIREVSDQFELRKALECFVVRSIAGRLGETEKKSLRRNVKQQTLAATRGEVAKLCELDAEFHLLLCEVLKNSAIIDCLVQHRAKMHRVIFEVMSRAPGRLKDAAMEHQRILKAIEDGKAVQASKLMEKHLEFGKQYLVSTPW